MSRLLSRILLALFMLPLAALLYLVTCVWYIDATGYYSDVAGMMLANVLTAAFVGGYWVLLWRRTVRWTTPRVSATLGLTGLSVMLGLILGFLVRQIDDSFAAFVGGAAAIMTWPALTVIAWRESATERATSASLRQEAVTCPNCGYNLTGLTQAICPECGARYPLEQLFAQQRSREQAQLGA